MARCLAWVVAQQTTPRHQLIFLARPDIDLRQPDSLRAPVLSARPDVILSCAAMTNVDACEADRDGAFAVNAEGPAVLAELADALDIPIIHLSTDYVFSGLKGAPYVEEDVPDPINTYGQSKLAGEIAITQAKMHVVVRPTWIYSPFGGFVRPALAQAAAHMPVTVVADQLACPTSGLDLAHTLLSMAARLVANPDPSLYGLFHAAGSTAAHRSDVVRSALSLAGHNAAKIREVESAAFFRGARRPLYSVLNSSKLEAMYGLRLPGWQEAVGEAINMGKGLVIKV